MRFHRRTILWLGLTILATVGWVRSHYHADTIMYSTQAKTFAFGLMRGSLCAMFVDRGNPAAPPIPDMINLPRTTPYPFKVTGVAFRGPPWNPSRRQPSTNIHFPGFKFTVLSPEHAMVSDTETPLTVECFKVAAYSGPTTIILGSPADIRVIAIPFWLLALLALTPLALPLLRRPRSGRCPNCNYDLRATPDRCPECGHLATPGDGPTAPQ